MRSLCLSTLALSLLASSPAFAIGAIAVEDEQGMTADEVGYGIVTGHSSKEAASAAAIRECRGTGNSSCESVLWFETCGAYAGSRDYFGIGHGRTEADAINKALDDCGESSCRLVVSGCE